MSVSFVNGASVSLDAIPTLKFEDFAAELSAGAPRILAYWRLSDGRVACVRGNPATKRLEAFATPFETYRPLTSRVPAIHRFEAELLGADEDVQPVTPLKGEAAHEVAVGPVHAGVIEPGHFRFQCLGEDVHSLEIRLGYQHRGAEKLIVEATTDARRLALAETVAGDTSIAATLAATKALSIPLSNSTSDLNLLLELERIANHVGDLGALSGDVAYLPTASFCGRIRGEYLNMTAEFVGNRFGHHALLAKAPTAETYKKVLNWFVRTEHELFHALDLLFSEAGAVERFEGTGKVPRELAQEIGLVGMAGRASGLTCDSRIDFPMADETIAETLVATAYEPTGDVLSRARQRYEELKVSHEIVRRLLAAGPVPQCVSPAADSVPQCVSPAADSVPQCVSPAAGNSHPAEGVLGNAAGETHRSTTLTIAVVEAWRGELVHLAVRDADGRLAQYKIFDPSYHNWFGLAQALKGEQISNFPICNKSFNLSYCGVDR